MICEFLEKKVIAGSQHEFALNKADQLAVCPLCDSCETDTQWGLWLLLGWGGGAGGRGVALLPELPMCTWDLGVVGWP